MRTPVEPVSTSIRSTVAHWFAPCAVPGTHTVIEANKLLMPPIELSTRIGTVLFLSVLMLLALPVSPVLPVSPDPLGGLIQSGVAFQPRAPPLPFPSLLPPPHAARATLAPAMMIH